MEIKLLSDSLIENIFLPKSVIEFCVNKDPEFEEAYTLLQELYKISRLSSFETAKKDILEWCEKIDNSEFNLSEFKRVSLTYRSWIKEIVNSFIMSISA